MENFKLLTCGAYEYDQQTVRTWDKKRCKDSNWLFKFDGEICDGYIHYRYDSKLGGIFVQGSIMPGIPYCPNSKKAEQIKSAHEEKEIIHRHKICTFANYDKNYNGHEQITRTIKKFPEGCCKILYFWGDNRIGKTHLILAKVKYERDRGTKTVYIRAEELAEVFKEVAGSVDFSELNEIMDSDLLCIDDIGREPRYNSFPPAFVNLLEKYRGAIILVSNFELKEICERHGDYSAKIFARLAEGDGVVKHVFVHGKPFEQSKGVRL